MLYFCRQNKTNMETENINAMISSYERIEGEYSFKEFLKEANIKEGTYKCISDLLVRSWQTITVTLTEEQIKTLNYIRDNNRHQVNLECADPITKKMTISGLETIFGEMCQLKDERGKRLWLTEDGNLERFWGKDNKEQLDNYDYIANILAEYKDNKKNDIRLSFNQKSLDFTDDDVRQSIYAFFGLIRNDQEVVDYINTLLSVIDSKGQINTKSTDELLNSEKAPRFIARSFVSIVKPDFINKNDNIRYNYKDIWKTSNQDNVKYADILNKVIILFLNESSKPYHFWSNFLKFLNVLRLLRNALSHYKGSLVEEGEQLPVACFILHSYVGTFLAITKNLQNQDALLPYDERQKTLTVYYKQDLNRNLFRNDKGEELSDEEEEEILKNLPKPRLFRVEKVEVEPFDLSKGYVRYPIERGPGYTISWGEGKSAVEVSIPYDTLWKSASSNPIAIWNGVKYYFFSDLSTVYAELDPYIQNAQKKDVEALTGLVKTLNGIVSNLGSSTDANTEIVNGLKASVEKIQDKLNVINEGIKKGNKQRNVIIAMLGFLCVIIAIWFIFDLNDRFPFLSSNDDPKTLIEKGNQYLREGDELFKNAFLNGVSHDEPHSYQEQESRFVEAAASYRRAIRKYEDILAIDSLNVEANINLAKMLLRGKGCYDPILAEKYAKRVSNEKSGEGLYLYLLFYNGKIDEATNILKKIDKVVSRDEYIELVDALLKIYGTNKRSTQEIQDLFYKIMNLEIPEARFWISVITMNGVKAQNSSEIDNYLISPSPIEGAFSFNGLARLFCYPYAMTPFSNFLEGIGQIEFSITNGFFAEMIGIKECAPITWYRMLKYYDIEKFGPQKKAQFEKVARETRHQGGLAAEFVGFCQSLYNLNMEDINEAIKLSENLDSLLASVKNRRDVYLKDETLGILQNIQVTLNLISGDYSTATDLAMELDDCRDSIAVSNYLLGICYAKGYGGTIKDSIKSDSLIRSSAEKGYIAAIFTQLRKEEPTGKWVVTQKWPDINYKDTKHDVGVSRHNSNTITLGASGQISEFHYSKYAIVPESIWKKSPSLSMILDSYWSPYYGNEISPYIYYCPKEYQIMCEVRRTAFEKRNGIWFLKDLLKAVEEDLINKLDIGLTYAINNNQRQIALIMIAMRDELAKDYFNYDYSKYITKPFVDWILEDFKGNGALDLSYKMVDPLYAY